MGWGGMLRDYGWMVDTTMVHRCWHDSRSSDYAVTFYILTLTAGERDRERAREKGRKSVDTRYPARTEQTQLLFSFFLILWFGRFT